MTESVFREQMQALALTFAKNKETMEAMLDPYWRALKDLPDRDFIAAVGKAVSNEDRFPKAPRLRELAGHALHGVSSATGGGAEATKIALFMCPRCNYDFCVFKRELLEQLGGYFCQSCQTYRGKRVYYATRYLHNLWLEQGSPLMTHIPLPTVEPPL